MSRSVRTDYDGFRYPVATASPAKLLAVTPRKAARLAYIAAYAAELDARRAFHLDQTSENLTAWATARNELADKETKL